jgi:hypothetical protein
MRTIPRQSHKNVNIISWGSIVGSRREMLTKFSASQDER